MVTSFLKRLRTKMVEEREPAAVATVPPPPPPPPTPVAVEPDVRSAIEECLSGSYEGFSSQDILNLAASVDRQYQDKGIVIMTRFLLPHSDDKVGIGAFYFDYEAQVVSAFALAAADELSSADTTPVAS